MDTNRKVVAYRLIELGYADRGRQGDASGIQTLEKMLEDGWELYGSPCTAGGLDSLLVIQALVKLQ